MSILDLYSPDQYFSPIKTGQWAPGQFCWIIVPNPEEIPKVFDIERSRPQEHTKADFTIRPATAANDFKKPDRILPLYYLNLRTSEELLVQRAKKRPGVILNCPLELDVKLAASLSQGQKHQHDRSLFVIPCYGTDNEERRGGFLPEICQRAKYLVYRRYFYVPDYPQFKIREGVLRFDRIQVVTGKNPAAIVPMNFAFSKEIFAICRAMFFYCVTGEQNPDLRAVRELLVEQYQKYASPPLSTKPA
jgi:hypothetical protein